jgi:hypothetical protein
MLVVCESGRWQWFGSPLLMGGGTQGEPFLGAVRQLGGSEAGWLPGWAPRSASTQLSISSVAPWLSLCGCIRVRL